MKSPAGEKSEVPWASPSGGSQEQEDGDVPSLGLESGERVLTAVRIRPMSIREHRDQSRPIILVDDEDDSKSTVVLLDPRTLVARGTTSGLL